MGPVQRLELDRVVGASAKRQCPSAGGHLGQEGDDDTEPMTGHPQEQRAWPLRGRSPPLGGGHYFCWSLLFPWLLTLPPSAASLALGWIGALSR